MQLPKVKHTTVYDGAVMLRAEDPGVKLTEQDAERIVRTVNNEPQHRALRIVMSAAELLLDELSASGAMIAKEQRADLAMAINAVLKIQHGGVPPTE